MIIDTSYLEPLYKAEQKETYNELLEYMLSLGFDRRFYSNLNIYYETYEYDEYTNLIFIPLSISFLLNYLYGRDYHSKIHLARAKSILIKPKADPIRDYYLEELEYCNNILTNGFRLSYEEKYGIKRAKQIKQKLSISMSNLSKDIILKRNKSISEYASSRPKSHNENISKSKRKKVIDLKTGKKYDSAVEASKDTDICVTYIRECCLGYRKFSNNNFLYEVDYNNIMKDIL